MQNKLGIKGISKEICMSYEHAMNLIGISNSWKDFASPDGKKKFSNTHLM